MSEIVRSLTLAFKKDIVPEGRERKIYEPQELRRLAQVLNETGLNVQSFKNSLNNIDPSRKDRGEIIALEQDCGLLKGQIDKQVEFVGRLYNAVMRYREGGR